MHRLEAAIVTDGKVRDLQERLPGLPRPLLDTK